MPATAVLVPALRSDTIGGYPPDEHNRVLAYRRDNVVVVLSDHWPNPWVAGNGGEVRADRPGRHGFGRAAALTIPANGLLVFVN